MANRPAPHAHPAARPMIAPPPFFQTIFRTTAPGVPPRFTEPE